MFCFTKSMLECTRHRRMIKTEEKAKGDVLECCTYHSPARMILNKSSKENILLDRMVVWYGVNRMITHLSKASIPRSSLYSINPFLQNHPGGKYLVRQGIKSITSLKQQRRLLPSLLSLSFFYGTESHIQYF